MVALIITARAKASLDGGHTVVLGDGILSPIATIFRASNARMGRRMFLFSLAAGSLLVADALAIHNRQPPVRPSLPRRADPRFRRGAFDGSNARLTVPATSTILASSKSEAATPAESDITNGLSHELDDVAAVQHTSASTKRSEAEIAPSEGEEEAIPIRPRMDELDKRMMKIAIPCIANFAINPLVGAVDLFWVNRMGNALAVAGQAAANQVFNSLFWVVSVLPSVTATLVSKANASGNEGELQDAVCQALFLGVLLSLVGTGFMLKCPDKILSSVLKDGAPALQFARPYLFIRAFAFLPSLISLIGYSAFRGTLDTSTPLKISATSNALNAVLDPILMFGRLSMGVSGAALATLAAEIMSAFTFMYLMLKRGMIRWSKLLRLPSWANLKPLLKGGAALQLRNVSLNLTFLAVTRVTQSLDETGVAAAAHAMSIQTFQLGGVVLLALSLVAQTVVPNELIEKVDSAGKRSGGKRAAKNVVNRLMGWGFLLGGLLGTLQLVMLPLLQKASPLPEVRQAAVMPSVLASVYQLMNGLVFIGEGVMVGCGNFLQLSISTALSTVGCLLALNTLSKMFGLTGVWMSFGVFNILRLAGVWIHQTRTGALVEKKGAKQG